jgi:hypothetical protein
MISPFDSHSMPKTGHEVELLVELDEIHLFDAATEKRLN